MTQTQQLNPAYTRQSGSNPCLPPKLATGRARIRLYHVVGPTCWWSWGYEAVIHRVRLVYGDQVDVRMPIVPVWQDLDGWLSHNGMDRKAWENWARESQKTMGVPIFTSYATSVQPKDSTPAALAILAARRQGQAQGERMARAILRRSTVEGRNVAVDAELLAAATESGLDLAAFKAALADRKGLEAALAAEDEAMPHLPLGFYNLAVESDDGRRVVLDNSFDPKAAEDAIDYLSGGRLRKNTPTDPVEYLRATGPAPLVEIARVFSWPAARAETVLAALQKEGKLRTVELAGATHYSV
jgi:protein-disulfide isomerase-like protein with CxxC motif